jgi:hypothetical protein
MKMEPVMSDDPTRCSLCRRDDGVIVVVPDVGWAHHACMRRLFTSVGIEGASGFTDEQIDTVAFLAAVLA